MSGEAQHKPRRLYRFPWAGVVDLDAVVSVSCDNGRVVCQLHDGAYVRGPSHPKAREVAEHLTDTLCDLAGNEVIYF